jgi:hypothetical protein
LLITTLPKKMKWFRQHGRNLGKLAGLLLILAGSLVAYGWFYKLAPMRHLADPRWRDSHSEKARWLEEQTDYQRMGSSPDLEFRGDRIGYYGNKNWFLWLEGKATTDKNFRVCGCTETALAFMSNQHVNSWGEWTKTNKGRTQEEWIRDGFSQYGVSVRLPPNPSDAEPLLKLIGRKGWNFLMGGPQGTNAPEAVPSYIQYNAFRWLRDSGFNPTTFAISNATLVATQDLTVALIKYSRWHGEFPGRDDLGVLAFGNKPERAEPLPMMLEPKFRAAAYSLMIVPVLAGSLLLFFLRAKRKPKPCAELNSGLS